MTRAESKMSDAERRFRIAMLEKKVSRNQVAQDNELEITTLGNIIRGGRCSAATKRKLTQYFGRTIWEDTPVELRLGKDFEFVFPAVKLATEFIKEIERDIGAGTVFRRSPRCRTVGFLKEVEVVLSSSSSRDCEQQGEKNRELSASSHE